MKPPQKKDLAQSRGVTSALPDTLPETMRAIEIRTPGGPDVLHEIQTAVPRPAAGQVLIKIAYAGVNRPDALQRAGLYAPPPDASPLPGLEAAGHIAAVGQGVTRWAVGDAVTALLPGGGYAEYAVTHEGQVFAIPPRLDLQEAACLPETCMTVWSNVVMRGGLKSGEKFLVHGGASGIGTTAIQIAKALGARVFTTVGRADKQDVCQRLGAERAFNYKTDDWGTYIKEQGGVDVILDMVGGPYVVQNIDGLAHEGRLIQIAFLQGSKVELNLAKIMMRRLTLTGSTLRPQSDHAKAQIAAEVEHHVWPMISAGRFAPLIDSCFPLAQAAAAHQRMEASEHIGKIVLEVAAP